MLRLSDILKKYREKSKKVEPEEIKQVENEIKTEEVKPLPQVQEPKVSISSAVCKGLSNVSCEEIVKLYEGVLSYAKHIYVSELEQSFVPLVNKLLEKLVDTLCAGNNGELLRICSADYPRDEDYLYGHVANVCIIAIEIGRGLGYERARLMELGIAAFVHDIGIIKYLDIINKNQILSKVEYDKVREHPHNGSEILSRFGKELGPAVIDVVRQEHERIDGSGYPLGLKGDQISEYAKIVGLVDVYEAMLHKRPYRNKYTSLEAIQTILKSKQAFEPKFIKILMGKMGIFPVGIPVRLNTKEIGVVIKVNPDLPLRPVVKITLDAYNKKLKQPKLIDLANNPAIYIDDCLKDLPCDFHDSAASG